MDSLLLSLALGLVAGITIPLGAHLASVERIRPLWLETELRHSIIAFGGGVLLAAVSLVLVPQGIAAISPAWVVVAFSAGGLAFFFLDRLIANHGGGAAQFMAMMLDFVPEALALGAALAGGAPAGLLLALLIGLQNFPEGFNAFRELTQGGRHGRRKVIDMFWLLALVGPLCAYLGHQFLVDSPALVGAVMLFAAGGIIYLTFEEIAPRAVLKRHWAPPLGAVAGFLVGLVGQITIG